jgi:hypothetical protein
MKIQKVSAMKYFFLNTEGDGDERKLFEECQKELSRRKKKCSSLIFVKLSLQTSSLTGDVAEIRIRSFFKFGLFHENVTMMITMNFVMMESFSFLNSWALKNKRCPILQFSFFRTQDTKLGHFPSGEVETDADFFAKMMSQCWNEKIVRRRESKVKEILDFPWRKFATDESFCPKAASVLVLLQQMILFSLPASRKTWK